MIVLDLLIIISRPIHECLGIATVTGAAQGIGRAGSVYDDGFEVVCAEWKKLQTVADVSDEAHVKGMIDDVVWELVNWPLVWTRARRMVATMVWCTSDLDNWDATYAQMIAQGRGGRLVGASFLAGNVGQVNQIAYYSAKFRARTPLELGRHGIIVNSYAPGAIATAMCAVGYVGKSEEVVSLVSYLVSKEAHYITGRK
ncbi:NAD(P)-binding protein [Imleria badia]|nr:NAD(P)-binding protein [Imleria badia]